MRIRTIKPEFFIHEDLYELEASTKLPLRLAYIGLWCAADREGRFKWEPRRLGIQIMPYDKVDFSKVMDGLESGGLIIRYGESAQYGCIPSFLNHQCINLRESKSVIPALSDIGLPKKVAADPEFYKYNGVNIQPKLSEAIMQRDGALCCRCSSLDDLTIDHIFPRSIGGTHAPSNLRVMCRSCNSARPVAGQGLIDDLASDGLTLDDMQRTCMHVKSTCVTFTQHVSAYGEGNGKEQGREGNKSLSPAVSGDDAFDQFWKAYPKKTGKLEAQKAFQRLKCSHILADKILPALEAAKRGEQWQKNGGQFIPNPATWLNRGGWDDEQTDLLTPPRIQGLGMPPERNYGDGWDIGAKARGETVTTREPITAEQEAAMDAAAKSNPLERL